MSGGSLDYFYRHLEEHNRDFGDKELDELVSDLAELFYAREWYLSGDTSIGHWREARDAFKEKWFGRQSRQERIKRYLVELCDEVRESFGISRKRCAACRHWKAKSDTGQYGKCEKTTGRLVHRSEDCGEYEERGADKETH